jgi:hypothetical protein
MLGVQSVNEMYDMYELYKIYETGMAACFKLQQCVGIAGYFFKGENQTHPITLLVFKVTRVVLHDMKWIALFRSSCG